MQQLLLSFATHVPFTFLPMCGRRQMTGTCPGNPTLEVIELRVLKWALYDISISSWFFLKFTILYPPWNKQQTNSKSPWKIDGWEQTRTVSFKGEGNSLTLPPSQMIREHLPTMFFEKTSLTSPGKRLAPHYQKAAEKLAASNSKVVLTKSQSGNTDLWLLRSAFGSNFYRRCGIWKCHHMCYMTDKTFLYSITFEQWQDSFQRYPPEK